MKSPRPCGAYTKRYSGNEDCYICKWESDSHDHSQTCANCQETLPSKEFKVLMADTAGGDVFLETDYFCNRKCLRHYLDVWGF